MAKTINLSNLFDKHFINDCDEVYDAEFEIIEFAKAVVCQALELAAENAKTMTHTVYPLTPMINGTYPIFEEIIIDKKSILNTINQIK